MFFCLTVSAFGAEDDEDKVEETSEQTGREMQGFSQEVGIDSCIYI